MSNGERGCKADDKLEGLLDKNKQTITAHLFPTSTQKMQAVKKLGENLLKDPGRRFDGMKLMIQDQEKVDLLIENPYHLFTDEECDTVKWALCQVEEELSSKCPGGAKLAYLAFKNFLKLMVQIETDQELVTRRWDT